MANDEKVHLLECGSPWLVFIASVFFEDYVERRGHGNNVYQDSVPCSSFLSAESGYTEEGSR